jgi:hypothetical protein
MFSTLQALSRQCERFAVLELPAGVRLPAIRQAQAVAKALREALETAEEEAQSL